MSEWKHSLLEQKVNRIERENQGGCFTMAIVTIVFSMWLVGAIVVGSVAWDASQNLWTAIKIGAGWPFVLPSMVIEFLGDAIGG